MEQWSEVYRQQLFGTSDPGSFSSRALWDQEGQSWVGVLPCDPQFEICWSVVGDEIASAPIVVSPVTHPIACDVPARDLRLRILRVRPDRVQALFGHDATDLARTPRFELTRLGPEWTRFGGFSRSRDLEAALLHQGRCAAAASEIVRLSIGSLVAPEGRELRRIARDSGYSYEQWLRTLKRACGVTPGLLRAHARLNRAGTLARRSPAMSMDEVAWSSGYAEASSLARAAMTLGGQTFRQWASAFTMPD